MMNQSITRLLSFTLLAGLAVAGFADTPAISFKSADKQPGWETVQKREKLRVERVADLDAYRQLAERIYGFEIAAGTTVYDYVLQSDAIKNKMTAVLKGAKKQTDKTRFLENGMITVAYGVNLRTVIEIIAKSEEVKNGTLKVNIEKNLEYDDKLIETVGTAALPGSKAMKMVRSKRAAELDAYRKLAERFVGVKLDSKTTVRDFCLENDQLQAAIVAYLKGIKPIKIDFLDDGSCEITMQLKIREVIETVETLVKTYKYSHKVTTESIRNVNREFNDKTFTVVGKGAARKDETVVDAPTDTASAVDPDEIYRADRQILKRVISGKVIID